MKQKKTLAVMVLVIFSVVLLSLSIVSQTVDASNQDAERSKVISSVEIKCGDTLWNIASQYYTDDYQDLASYVDEIKECNGLASDTIHAGEYIVVPYFVSDSSRLLN